MGGAVARLNGCSVAIPPSERFWSKVNKTEGCWFWCGTKHRSGYGSFWLDGKDVPAHRVSLAFAGRVVPLGLVPDHLCRNRMCVNPDHIEIVTHKENIHRGEGRAAVNVRKEYCPKGHKYEGENVRINRSRQRYPSRICKECHRLRGHRRSKTHISSTRLE